MMEVLDRTLKCPLSEHNRAMTFKIEQASVKSRMGELRLCGHLKNMAKKLRELQNLRTLNDMSSSLSARHNSLNIPL